MRYLIGIGNYTAFDDSVGLRVAETIAEDGIDRGFRAIELGGNLIDLLHYLDEGTEFVLLVDSARMGRVPGDYAFFEPGEVESRRELAGFSTHEADVLKVLGLAASLGRALPAITVMGIEPEEIRTEVGLSPALSSRMDEYVGAAIAFLAASSA